jgi:hypothetical protein
LFANPSGGICGRIGDPNIGDTLWQAVTTVPGQRYLLAGELRSEDQYISTVTVSALNPTSGEYDGSRHAVAPVGAFHRFTVAFTASSASTRIEISGDRGDFVYIDNVSLIPIPPGADGAYAGTIVTTVNVTVPALSAKSSRKVTAQMDADGSIVLLDGTEGIITGYILSSGQFSLVLPDGLEVTGTALIRGRRIQLEFDSGSYSAVSSSGAPVPNTVKKTLTLTRR